MNSVTLFFSSFLMRYSVFVALCEVQKSSLEEVKLSHKNELGSSSSVGSLTILPVSNVSNNWC